MVGERYRDLLSAADSIVRMSEAAEKLASGFDRVGKSVAIASSRSEIAFTFFLSDLEELTTIQILHRNELRLLLDKKHQNQI